LDAEVGELEPLPEDDNTERPPVQPAASNIKKPSTQRFVLAS
jgi:hypothetical protein